MFALLNPHRQRRFSVTLRAYSVAIMVGHKPTVDNGGKIILPPLCLEILAQISTVFPMLFKITNREVRRESHCGVLEFIAEAGMCYLPHWMMRNLILEEGDEVFIESATLPVATFSKFEPQSTEFLNISNPKAILENALRHFACLTTGDTIAISYNDKIYDFKVLETKPGQAVSIIECDMDVDFAPPIGYVEPSPMPKPQASTTPELRSSNYAAVPLNTIPAFGGTGNRLDGKEVTTSTAGVSMILPPTRLRGVPDYDYEPGTLNFARDLSYFANQKKTDTLPFEAFVGKGTILRNTKPT